MIKGLAITPPIIGRISIGRVVERNGKRFPEKDDQFTITTQIQGKEGWLLHPQDALLRKAEANGKLRCIPIRLLFNAPDLNLRSAYSLFDRNTGRPMCTGNGESCRRYTGQGVETLPCPSPEGCELAKAGCKAYARLNVRIGDEGDKGDEMGMFIFRTTSFNSVRTLAARLTYYQALSGNLLSCMPLSLQLRAKTTTMSHRTPIYYADITTRDGLLLEQTIATARDIHERRVTAGFDQAALDEAARVCFANGAFEESEEDVPEIVEEFFPEQAEEGAGQEHGAGHGSLASESVNVTLREKLERKSVKD